MDPPFEAVHTVDHYYDSPRSGVADFRGKPQWQVAEREGTAPALLGSAERVLPGDAARHAELRAILAPYLRTDLAHRIIARGDFRSDKTGQHGGKSSPLGSLMVRWTPSETY